MSHFNFAMDDSGQQGLGNSEMMYSKVQRVYLKSRNKEERQRDLRVTVDLLIGLSPLCRQHLSLQLTDDDDPFFLYTLIITEEDFKTVKTQQGLLVDFDHFPAQFIRLLEQCNTANDNLGPRFLLILDSEYRENATDTRQTYLKIVETNHFKHLCHLDLKIVSGSDTEVKKQMAIKIKLLKESILSKEKELSRTSTQLTECFQRLDVKSYDVNELQHKWTEEKNAIVTRHIQELNQEREKLAAAQYEWQTQCEKDKREVEMKNRSLIANLESQINRISAENKTYIEKYSLEESLNRKHNLQLESLKQELANAHLEVNTLRKQNSKLDVDYHEKEKLCSSLRTRLGVVEQECQEKSLLLGKQQDQLRSAREQNNHLEDGIRDKESNIQRKQTSVKKISEELIKANEIISTLQSENATLKTKVKLRTNIALEQERLLNSKQNELADVLTKVTRLEQKTRDLEMNEMKLRESLANAEEKIEAKDKQISKNDNLISWLNRQLNAQNETQPPGVSSTPIFMPYTTKRRVALDNNGRQNGAAVSHIPPLPLATQDLRSRNGFPTANGNGAEPTSKPTGENLRTQPNPNLLLSKRIASTASAYFPKPTT